MVPTIREASVSDVSAIRRIAEAAWTTVYDDVLSPATIEAALAEWYEPRVVREYVSRSDVTYLVAESPQRVCGYVGGGPGDVMDVAELGAIYVDPDRWREGIGSALLAAFEERCAAEGFDVVSLRVLAGNKLAQSFYRDHGYEPVDERQTDLFGEAVRERVFRKTV